MSGISNLILFSADRIKKSVTIIRFEVLKNVAGMLPNSLEDEQTCSELKQFGQALTFKEKLNMPPF